MDSNGLINPLTSPFPLFNMTNKPCASSVPQPPRNSFLQNASHDQASSSPRNGQFLNTDIPLPSLTPNRLSHDENSERVLQVLLVRSEQTHSRNAPAGFDHDDDAYVLPWTIRTQFFCSVSRLNTVQILNLRI
ncbi:hypothetical protein LWI28_022273 [Acer negundo]|uniref:Uncharacterized protein n=1 Tax=Acer negundo TaxID=4023 RepID=A0AAD5NJI8_ACENE|nr:hypothetical protein LWI28_022273 [Acer negundo]